MIEKKGEKKLLELKQIGKAFSDVKVLDSVDFDLFAGECHSIVGANGAGKSTLMKIVIGEYKKDSGEIFINGNQIEINSPHHAKQLGISMVPQEFCVVPHLNGVENVFLGKLKKNDLGFVSWKYLKNKAKELIKLLGLEIDLSIPVKQLTVPEIQVIQIARALLSDPKIIIFDEPTAMLGDKDIEALFGVINTLKQRDIGIIYISHRLAEIFSISERVTVLRDGEVVHSAYTEDIEVEEVIELMLGKSLEESYPEKNENIGDPVLEVMNLGKKGIVENVSFKLRRGEVLGIAGLIGAGKTSLVSLMFGKVPYDSGKIVVNNREAKINSPSEAKKNRIALIPDDRRNEGLIMDKKIRENISITILDRLKKAFLINRKKEVVLANQMVGSLNIKCSSIEQKIDFLSGGNQQKVVLAKWLLADSDIILFDEPTKGIDVGAKRQFYELINELSKEGKAIIVISQELEELIGLSHKILIMWKGKAVKELNTDETNIDEIMRYAVKGG